MRSERGVLGRIAGRASRYGYVRSFGFFVVQFIGLSPGSSTHYNMYWLRKMPVHWTRTSRAPAPAGDGGGAGGPRWRRPAGGTFLRDLASLEPNKTSLFDHASRAIECYPYCRLREKREKKVDIYVIGTGGIHRESSSPP